ncbi:MAG: NAD(P)-dependent glycerol-3-phosphate dehydrogenase [Oligoflexia bacterium]|nr:NAD(P)-dependent glycerol-3-phosphate dehydrogenase [Oligoflexia bacterium]
MAPAVAVIGLGNWGTALAQHLAVKGLDVLGWSVDQPVVQGINAQHRNPLYLPNAKLSERITATNDLEAALGCATIVFAVPSKFMAQVLPKLNLRAPSIFVSVVKGIDPSTLDTPLQLAAQHLSSDVPPVVLSGPSFAIDVVRQKPCGLVAASKDETAARKIAELFSGDCMKVYVSGDPLGVELGGIVKNVIALAVGVADGMQLGDSARAGLITRGLAEMMRLAEAMGADVMTLSGLSGLGDLAMTATSDTSRNRTVGLRLGRGESLSQIVSSLGSVAEGVTTAPLVLELARRCKVEMPITEQVEKLLKGERRPEELVRALVSRPIRKEF